MKQQPLNKHVRSFAETGRLVAGSQAYQQAFVALRQTALGRQFDISESATKSRLFVTQDFSNVVVVEWGKPLDEYSRPVHWILWSPTIDTALILSDFEADAIIPLIRDKKVPSTHLITYAAPVTRAMLVFDTLTLYTVPRLPTNWRAPTWLGTWAFLPAVCTLIITASLGPCIGLWACRHLPRRLPLKICRSRSSRKWTSGTNYRLVMHHCVVMKRKARSAGIRCSSCRSGWLLGGKGRISRRA